MIRNSCKHTQNEQDSNSDDSVTSELNCSVVVESSDSEHTPCKQNKQSTSSTSSTSAMGNSLSDAASQQAIYILILAQLLSISDRLNVLERKVKKDSDPKKREFKKRSPVLKLPRSHCHKISAFHLVCLVYKMSCIHSK